MEWTSAAGFGMFSTSPPFLIANHQIILGRAAHAVCQITIIKFKPTCLGPESYKETDLRRYLFFHLLNDRQQIRQEQQNRRNIK
jgi:hypothetical protein